MTIHHRSNDSTKTDEKGVIHIHVKLGHMYIELSCDVEVLILTPLWIKIQQKTEPTTLNSCGFIYILIILSRSCKYVSLYLIMWKFFSLLSIFKHTHVLPTIIFVKNLFPRSNSLKKITFSQIWIYLIMTVIVSLMYIRVRRGACVSFGLQFWWVVFPYLKHDGQLSYWILLDHNI